jgi:8-hydroxy-5-deazaflavin:NADPH oxidoreductase
MKLAIIGSGNIGSTLGKRWLEHGHEVVFGVRDQSSTKVATLRTSLGDKANVVTTKEAIRVSDVVLLAIPGGVVVQFADDHAEALENTIIIDAANSLTEEVMHNFRRMHELAPNAKLFRAFNSLGWENFETPVLNGVQIDHFYCGDEGRGQQVVHQLITDIGLHPIYLGGLEHTPTLDALTRLWFTLAFQRGYGRRVALKVIAEKNV